MNRLTSTLLALALFTAAPVFAQTNITGDWDVTVVSPQGSNTTPVTFKQDGDKVSGLFKSPQGELPFEGGKMTGDDLTFTFTITTQGMQLPITLTGKVVGDTIAGKADFGGFAEGEWNAKRSAATTTTSTATTTTTTTTTTTPSNRAPSLGFISLRRVGARAYARFRVCDDHTGRITIIERDSKARVLSVSRRFRVSLVSSCNVYVKSWSLGRQFRTHGRYVASLRAVDAQGRLSLLRSRSITFR
jgi:hypothetical protein